MAVNFSFVQLLKRPHLSNAPKFRQISPLFKDEILNIQVPSSGRSPVRQGDRWGADVDWVLAGTSWHFSWVAAGGYKEMSPILADQ